MCLRTLLKAFCTVTVFLLLGGAVSVPEATANANCGEDNQKPCKKLGASSYVDPMTMTPITNYWYTYTCNHTSLEVNSDTGLCQSVQAGTGLNCCTAVNYTDEYGREPTAVTKGYYATVDLNNAWIVVPNLEYPNWCVNNATHKNPVRSVEKWAEMGAYTARLLVNANFWSAGTNPYENRCNSALGLTVSNKVIVSPEGQVKRQNTASLVFFTPTEVRSTGRNAVIAENALATYGSKIQNAVTGFQLLNAGTYETQPRGIHPYTKIPRTAVGLSADGNTLYIVVVNPGDNRTGYGGTTLEGLADFLKSLGAYDAVTLDGSGSSQMFFQDSPTSRPIVTEPSDNECHGLTTTRCHRPIPVFLGIQ